MDYKDFGARIRLVRRKAGMTQEQLSEKIGMSASFLGHLERGTRVPSLETLVAICNELHVAPEYLLSASLHNFDSAMPEGLTDEERSKLGEFLRMAQETVRNWNLVG